MVYKIKRERVLVVQRWGQAWVEPLFKEKLLLGLSCFVTLLSVFPVFYQHIEKRNGFVNDDLILNLLPAYDVSMPIFIITWFIAILMIIRSIQNPTIFITFLYGFVILNLARIASISLIHFNPPHDLIPITDPISNIFYGDSYVTKDLFFSGHTATQFLCFLCLQKNTHKLLALIATFIMGMLVLIQHVHYTVDVVSAPVFAYICFIASTKIAGFEKKFLL